MLSVVYIHIDQDATLDVLGASVARTKEIAYAISTETGK